MLTSFSPTTLFPGSEPVDVFNEVQKSMYQGFTLQPYLKEENNVDAMEVGITGKF